jgi:transposase InsO family protein
MSERRACRLVGLRDPVGGGRLGRENRHRHCVSKSERSPLSGVALVIAGFMTSSSSVGFMSTLSGSIVFIRNRSWPSIGVRRLSVQSANGQNSGAETPNEVWSMDFVMDSLANGRRLKCLTLLDDLTPECIDIAVDHGISGQYVTRILEQAARFRGYPQAIRTDGGAEVYPSSLDSVDASAWR